MWESLWSEIVSLVDRIRPVIDHAVYERPYEHVMELWVEACRRLKYRSALLYEDGSVETYGAMYDRAMRLAYRLRALGVKVNDVVAVDAPRHLGLPCWILGIWLVGGVYFPVVAWLRFIFYSIRLGLATLVMAAR